MRQTTKFEKIQNAQAGRDAALRLTRTKPTPNEALVMRKIWRAAQHGRTADAVALLKTRGASELGEHQQDAALHQALHVAAANDHVETVKALVAQRACLERASSPRGEAASVTPLMRAAMWGSAAAARELVLAGARRSEWDPHAERLRVCDQGKHCVLRRVMQRTPLHWAVRCGHAGMVRMLAVAVNDMRPHPLDYAVQARRACPSSDVSVLRALVQARAYPRLSWSSFALGIAAANGDARAVSALLHMKANAAFRHTTVSVEANNELCCMLLDAKATFHPQRRYEVRMDAPAMRGHPVLYLAAEAARNKRNGADKVLVLLQQAGACWQDEALQPPRFF